MKLEYVIGYAVLAFLVLTCSACQTMSTKAESIGFDGSSQMLKQTCVTGPFGKLAEGAGTMSTEQTKDGAYKVATGQSAKGVDMATGQVAALNLVIQGFMQAFTQYVQAHPQQPAGPTLLEQLSPILVPQPGRVTP